MRNIKYKKKLFYNNVYHLFINSIHLEYMNDIGWAVYTYMEHNGNSIMSH